MPGDRVPSSRVLARRLRIARNTVGVAYDRLTAEGYISTRAGSGTFVAARPIPYGEAPTLGIVPELGTWGASLPATAGLLGAPRARLDFRPGSPSTVGLNASISLMKRAMGKLSKWNFQGADANDPAGCARIRELLANYLRRTHGLACRGEELVLTNGTQQSLDLIGRLIANDGRVVAVEDPGYPVPTLGFSALGFKVAHVPVDGEGIVVSMIPKDTCLIYTTPNRQFPLGYPMSLDRRSALLQFASQVGAYIIEDDYDGELNNVEGRARCLKTMDRTDRVIYLSSMSKYLVPQIRFGCMLAPNTLRNALVNAKWLTDRQLSLPVQLIVETLLHRGLLPLIIRRADRDYTLRHETLRAAIRKTLSKWLSITSEAPGMHLTTIASPELNVDALIELAEKNDVGLYSLQLFATDSPLKGIVFGLGSLTSAQILEGVDVIHRVLKSSNFLLTNSRVPSSRR